MTDEEILANDDLFELLRPAIEADLRMTTGYRYQPDQPLGLPISVFAASRDYHLDQAGLLTWRRETTANVELAVLEGDHLFVGAAWDLLGESVVDAATGGSAGERV